MKQVNNWMAGAILIICASAFTLCTNEDNPVAPSTGIIEKMLGVWMCEEIESGISPNSQKPYDKIVSSYIITPDGTGFFESLYYNGGQLVETECDRNSSGKFTYEWVKDTEITCTDFESGEQWKVTYIRGVFTDWEDPDDPVTYTKEALSVGA